MAGDRAMEGVNRQQNHQGIHSINGQSDSTVDR